MTALRTRLVALLWLLAMGALVLGVWASIVVVPDATTWFEAIWALVFGSVFLAVGAILVVRRPHELIGRLCLAAGVLMATSAGLRAIAIVLDARPGPIPIAGLVAAQLISVTTELGALVLPAILLARFPSGRDRGKLAAVADAAIALAAAGMLLEVFAPGTMDVYWLRRPAANPLGIDALDAINIPAFASAGLIFYAIGITLSVAILVRRYRRSGPVVRAQIRWVAAAGVVPVICFIVVAAVGGVVDDEVGSALWTTWILSTMLLPIAIGIALMRYRLYDIDRIISRTIAYALVTALLAGAFLATNLVLTTVVVRGSPVEVAISTLVVAVLFQPLRRTVQHQIDRRFNRSHIDAERMVAQFLERTREEVDLDRLSGETRLAADGAVQPTASQVWLRGNDLRRGGGIA